MKSDLESLARILGCSTILGVGLALIWFVLYVAGVTCSLPMFDLTPHECAVVTYGGIGLLKILVYTLFLVPWIAVRLEIRRRKHQG